MAGPPIAFKLADSTLPVGAIPRVIGTLSTLPQNFSAAPADIPSDVVELRLDHLSLESDWLNRCKAIEAAGTPVIVTIRSSSEGGKWTAPETQRLELLQLALKHLSAVDIELRSELAPAVVDAAKRSGKVCIVSFHDFERTPALAQLEAVVNDAQELGRVVKISTMVNEANDIDTLRSLLLKKREAPLCVIGMGALGTETRVSFATRGSCLTYGYLDKPSAPGQLSAAQLVEQLRKLLPHYDRDYEVRKRMVASA